MKKLITLVLSAAMLLSLLCVTAFAETSTDCPGGDSCTHVAEITADGTTTHYDTLVNAVAAAKDGETVKLLRDAEGGGVMIKADNAKEITIDLDEHTYTCADPAVGSTGYESQGFHFEKGCVITIQNGTLNAKEGTGVKMLIQNYCDLTLNDVTVDGANLAGSGVKYTMSNNNGEVRIKNSVIKAADGGVAFDVYSFGSYTGANVTVENSDVYGKIEVGASDGANTTDLKLQIKSGTFTGTLDVTEGFAENVAITGGTFSEDVSEYIDDSEVAEVLIDNTYYVGDAATAAIKALRPGQQVTVVAGSVKIGFLTLEAGKTYTYPKSNPGSGSSNSGTNSGTTITQSPKTADAGIAVYGVMSVMSLLGMGYVSKKKSR